MASVGQQQPTFQFGVFKFNPHTGELRKQGVKLKLQEQPAQILTLLLEHAGEVVTREEIQKRLWPEGTYVDFDNAINSAIRKLRDALGDSPENPRFVETLARRGYRFIAPVSCEQENALPSGIPFFASPVVKLPTKLRLHTGAPSPSRPQPRRLTLLLGIAIAGLVAFIAVFLRRTDTNVPTDLHVAPLTSNTGLELQPALSPDGTRVAYAWSMPPQKQSAIYVKLNGPGDAVKMSKDLPRVFSPVWSPDGRWIAALQDRGQIGALVLIPALGGPYKELARVVKADPSADTCVGSKFPFICGIAYKGSVLAWSQDGKSLFTSAKVTPDSPPAIVRVSVKTGEAQPLTSPPKESEGDFGPAVSPNGQELAFARFRSVRTGDLYVQSLSEESSRSGSFPKRITTDGADIMTPAWTPDGRELIFSSDRGSRRELWRVPATGGKPVRLAGMGEDALDVAVSPSGRTLVYNHGHYTGSLWKMPIAGGKGGEPVRVTATTARDKFSHFSPDGKRIAFESGRSGVDEIWICDADGTNAVQLTNFGRGVTGSPRWSPNGRMIAFDSNVAGSFDVYVIPSDGGPPLQLTHDPSTDAVPSWSRDSAWVYFTSGRTGRAEVWKIRANGSSETQVTRDGGGLATESADGRDLYFVRGTEDSGDLFRMPVEGGPATEVLRSIRGRLFTVFPKGIYFATGAPEAELRYVEFATGSIRVITPLSGMSHADVSSDEHWALYPQPAMSDTNLMVVENFR